MDRDEAGLLAGIKAKPDDDLPRLVYADWLDEHGDASRAEFVRVQVELARLEREGDGCDRQDEPDGCGPFKPESKCFPCQRKVPLWRREAELMGAAKLLDDMPTPAMLTTGRGILSRLNVLESEGRYCEVFPRRGFVESVECDAAYWLAHGDAVLAANPVRSVRLTTWPNSPECDVCDDDGRPIVSGGPAEREYLRRRWPGVAFTLPSEQRRGLVGTLPPDFLTRDYTGEAFEQMRRAGNESARRANERLLRVILGDAGEG
jgi:uncharacterized protein (TIGR02996 family)